MADSANPVHVPVLLAPVLAAAAGASRAVDATLGDGGHAEALRGLGAEVLGIDRDPDAVAVSRGRLGDDGMRYLQAPYSAPSALAAVAAFRPEFILLDLGVSSRQLDEADRGFTFRPNAPLDMRMGDAGPTAAAFLNSAVEEELARVFYEYGDERQSRRLAREIARRRGNQPFAISDDLVNAVRATLGPRAGPSEFARLFQAVRIAVNDELSGLAVITYHSGEDRLVKLAFREWAAACICPPKQPICTCRGRPLGRLVPRKPIVPEPDEVAANPRARSAHLRIFQAGDAS